MLHCRALHVMSAEELSSPEDLRSPDCFFREYLIILLHIKDINRMKSKYIILPLLCICTAVAAQVNNNHHHAEDSTDVFYRHMQLNELTVTGVTGDTKLKYATTPVSIVSPQVLRSTASTNIIDAISHQPGVSQLTTGGSISKPIIRGLGYNRVVVMSEGVRQEGQQWGDAWPSSASSRLSHLESAAKQKLNATQKKRPSHEGRFFYIRLSVFPSSLFCSNLCA